MRLLFFRSLRLSSMTPAWLMGFALASAGACSSNAGPPPASNKRTWQLELPKANANGAAIVARVNEQPIFGHCVAIQAEAHDLSRSDALTECINFELLAQAAAADDTVQDEEVQRRGKEELVRAYLQERYPMRGPDNVPSDLVKRLWDKTKVPRYIHPELRNIVFCRIAMSPDIGEDSQEYRSAKKFFQGIYEELRDKRDLAKKDLFAPCFETFKAAGVEELKLHTFHLNPESQYDPAFHSTVFGSMGAGQVAPPLHTRFGWDLILITEVVPAIEGTLKQHEKELREVVFNNPVFQGQRDRLFSKWYENIAKDKQISTTPALFDGASELTAAAPAKQSPHPK